LRDEVGIDAGVNRIAKGSPYRGHRNVPNPRSVALRNVRVVQNQERRNRGSSLP
jgi:hypothetical protein